MPTQRALHVDLAQGRHDLVELESPHYVGPLEYAWEGRNENDPTILGIGPLADTAVPGADSLVIAGRSPLWDGFYLSLMEGAGPALVGLGCSLLSLRGKAERPSVLLLRRQGDTLEVRLDPLDPEPLWQGTHDGDGLFALLHALAARYGGESAALRILATGPAAARTRYGGIGSLRVEEGRSGSLVSWFQRGGFGSRLIQVHQLCGLVLATDEGASGLRELDPPVPSLARFRQGMSTAELEAAVHYQWSPRFKASGDFGATFHALRDRVLWFNASSVHLSQRVREDLFEGVLRPHFLTPFHEELERAGEHRACSVNCPLASHKVAFGRVKAFEPYAALGPQLGIVDHAAVDRLVRHCESLGFDVLVAGGVLGWLMERIATGLADPLDFELRARPRWSAEAFDPVEDSPHNAALALELASGLVGGGWGRQLAAGLRAAARKATPAAAALACYLANGESGEMIPHPFWTPGFFAPVPISGEYHCYYGLDFMPPRVLGRKSAQRMVEELMLQNFGICRQHRGWAEELVPELVNQRHGTTVDWTAHHRSLARRIYRRRKGRFWETERVVDLVATYLLNRQVDAAPDGELDRWVRRFRDDKGRAARAYWSEINAGLEEIFGT